MKVSLFLLSFALRLVAFSLQAADKPKIIMILADDVGLGNLGRTGGPFKTPNIDALAKGGTQFSHCFAVLAVALHVACGALSVSHRSPRQSRSRGRSSEK